MNQPESLNRIAEEFDAYYSNYDPYTKPLLAMQEEIYEAYKEEPFWQLKARMIRLFCEKSPIHLFRECPFFFEISSGRARATWGGLQSDNGMFLHNKNAHLWLNPYSDELAKDKEQGFLHAWNNPVGVDHFCVGYDTILKEGFEGIIRRANDALSQTQEENEKNFLLAAIDSCQSLIHLAGRFAQEAKRLAKNATNEAEKLHYDKIANAASRVPAKPARTFYEAFCTIMFSRECIGSVEGLGISTFGQIDRMLEPYYQADLDSGIITPEDAKLLFHSLLIYTDVRFEVKKIFNETSTTIIIGGCDKDGNIVYNDLTRFILQAVLEGRYVNTKINCRISSKHPKEYFEKIAEILTSNISILVMQNDDVMIPARVKQGQALEDARLYVSGGCHEVVLANTEVCARADTWINLPRILLATLENHFYDNWEDFYQGFLDHVKTYIERIVSIKNKYEQYWCKYSPLPLCSATITGCIENRKDLTEGGSKYATTSLSMLGTATMIDSLYAVKNLVWDTEKLSYREFCDILASDFDGQESLRQYIIKKLPKYGTNNSIINTFAAKVLNDLSGFSGQKNGRGGYYMPAFYPHDVFRPLGYITGATPDGRKKGFPLSRGCSPSEFIEVKSPLDIISSLEDIDFTNYADSFCTEITLPKMNKEVGINVLTAMITTFLEKGGSTLQINLLDTDMLREAQKNPDQHNDITVRVCGYSAVFVYLNTDQQEEIIERAIR